ncbi:hypothetical protein QYM36_012510 [Artemia franciscana]|uniref:Uncharacterized protein n=1 Tax=Artemia franciscana TaxID=6661 RepID=A0AA88HLV6_ARTSF|nr:hypothetical protein QYM36_012510 [Artemia franciscana]
MSEDSKKKQQSIDDFFLKTSTRPGPQPQYLKLLKQLMSILDAVPVEPWEKSLVKNKNEILSVTNKAIPLAVHSTKGKKFRFMAEGIGDDSDFESSSSESDNEAGELFSGTVDVADKRGGDTKHKRKKAGPKQREVEGVADTSDTGSSSSESELEELVIGTVGDVDKRKTGAGSKRKRTQVAPKRRSFVCFW